MGWWGLAVLERMSKYVDLVAYVDDARLEGGRTQRMTLSRLLIMVPFKGTLDLLVGEIFVRARRESPSPTNSSLCNADVS